MKLRTYEIFRISVETDPESVFKRYKMRKNFLVFFSLFLGFFNTFIAVLTRYFQKISVFSKSYFYTKYYKN